MGNISVPIKEFSNPTQLVTYTKSLDQTSKSKCLLNERYKFIYYGCDDVTGTYFTPEAVNSSGETGLAVTFWVFAVICLLLVTFFCVVVLIGISILVFISFQQHTCLQKTQQLQIELLITLRKYLRKKPNDRSQDVASRIKIQNPRCHHNMPFYQSSHQNRPFPPNVSSSPFHPRNNTPASSQLNLSFSSHASFSKSGPPSVSLSTSEDAQNDESVDSSGLTFVHPIRERVFQRTGKERMEETDWLDSEQDGLIPDDYRSEFPHLVNDRYGQVSSMQKWSGTPHSMHLRLQPLSSPQEYWL